MTRIARRIAVAIAIFSYKAVLPASTHAQSTTIASRPDSGKAALVQQLLVRIQAADQAIAMMEASLPAQRQSNPRVPAVFWDRFIVEARARRGELIDMIAAVYERQFTIDEVQQLLQFYNTPIGRKLLAVQPKIAEESLRAGQQWGQRIGERIGAQLAAEGVVISP